MSESSLSRAAVDRNIIGNAGIHCRSSAAYNALRVICDCELERERQYRHHRRRSVVGCSMAVATPARQPSSYFPGGRPRPALDHELEDIFPTGFPLKKDEVLAGPEYFFIDDTSSRASEYGGARRASAKHDLKPQKTQMDLQVPAIPGKLRKRVWCMISSWVFQSKQRVKSTCRALVAW